MSDIISDVNTDSVDSSSAEQTDQTNTAVPVENRVAELNRKFSKLERSLDEKFSQLISSMNGPKSQPAEKAVEATYGDPAVESVVNQALLRDKHAQSYQQAIQAYPELNPDSESFDERFHKNADSYYRALSSTNDPDAPLKAIRLAAMDLGKFQQVEREKIMADEAKRMRTLGDGVSSPKSAQKGQSSGLPDSVKSLAQLLKVDLKQAENHYKNYKGKK